MDSHDYLKLIRCTLPMQDYLAASRTILSNERTLLAYWRSAFTLVIAAVTLIKLFSEPFFHNLGYGLIVLAAILVIYGTVRYYKMNQIIVEMEETEAKDYLEKLEKKIEN